MITERNEYLEEQTLTQEVTPYNPTQTTSNRNAIPIIYGRRRTTGNIIYVYPGNNTNEIYYVVALSEGQTVAVQRVLIDGAEIAGLVAHNGITYADGIYTGFAQFSFNDGRSGTIYNPLLAEVKNQSFPNLSYLVVKLIKDPNKPEVFRNGIPNIEVELVGVLNDDPTPGEVIKDLLTNTRYGAGISASKVDITDADAYTDASVIDYFTIQGKNSTCNAIIDTAKTINQNIQSILNEYQLIMPRIEGVWYVKAEATGGSPTALTESDLVDSVSLLYPDANVRLDRVYAEFPNGYVDYTTSTVGVYFSGSLVDTIKPTTNLSGLERSKKISLANITNKYQARRLAETQLRKSVSQTTLNCKLTKAHINLNVGDLIQLSGVTPDNVNDTYKIIQKTVNQDFTISIQAVKFDSDFYASTQVGKIDAVKPIIPTGNGYLYYPKQSTGQTPVSFNLPPEIRAPGNIRPPEPTGADVYTIADAVSLDDNTDWYFVNTTDGVNKNTRSYNDGIRLSVEDQGSYGFLHGEFSLLYRYPNKPLYQNIAWIFPINSALNNYGFVRRVGNAFLKFYVGATNDINQGTFARISGNRATTFRESFNRYFNDSESILVASDDLTGLYTHRGIANRANTTDYGLNLVFGQKEFPSRPNVEAYANSYPFNANILGNIDIKFFGQAKSNGNWEYIGKKTVTYNYSNIANNVLRNSQSVYRRYTGRVMPS